MAVVIGLLRGVNVGGHCKISMEQLRSICVSLGLRDPQTYIQSGNVVFGAATRDVAKLAERLESAIEKELGFRPKVILRTAEDLRKIVGRAAFAKRPDFNPAKLAVFFLAEAPAADVRSKLATIKVGPEELQSEGRELFIYFPDGMGHSKLPPVLDRTLKIPATARNWNTVNKLLEMANAHSDSP
jgi:uncharacterized protein (DUF1697 family)